MVITQLRRNFFVFTKFSYLQPFREIMGRQDSVTNKQQTNTTDDHNTPSGFFQNPRANNTNWFGYNRWDFALSQHAC